MPELPNSVAYFATRLLSHNAVTRRMVPPLRLTDRAPWPCPPKPVAPSSIPQTVLFRSAPLRPSPVFPKPAPVDNADSDPSDSTLPPFATGPQPEPIASPAPAPCPSHTTPRSFPRPTPCHAAKTSPPPRTFRSPVANVLTHIPPSGFLPTASTPLYIRRSPPRFARGCSKQIPDGSDQA